MTYQRKSSLVWRLWVWRLWAWGIGHGAWGMGHGKRGKKLISPAFHLPISLIFLLPNPPLHLGESWVYPNLEVEF